MNERARIAMNFSQHVWFISNQIFDVKKNQIKCRKNKRAMPNFNPFDQKELGEHLTLEEGDTIFVIPRSLLEEYDEKLALYREI